MTKEYEWSVYDKRDLFLNRQQLLAIGNRTFHTREKRLEFQHLNFAVFNIPLPDHPSKACCFPREKVRHDQVVGFHGRGVLVFLF